jgi:hypothetical protein
MFWDVSMRSSRERMKPQDQGFGERAASVDDGPDHF